jgi:hypothetical protein
MAAKRPDGTAHSSHVNLFQDLLELVDHPFTVAVRNIEASPGVSVPTHP